MTILSGPHYDAMTDAGQASARAQFVRAATMWLTLLPKETGYATLSNAVAEIAAGLPKARPVDAPPPPSSSVFD